MKPVSETTIDDLTGFAGWSAMGRRMLTIPAILVMFFLVWGLAAVWLPLTLSADLIRGGKLRGTRFGSHLAWALGCEVYGILSCFGFWLLRQTLRTSGVRYRAQHLRLQSRWASLHFVGMGWIYGTRMEVEDPESLGTEPMLLFLRHASLLDTLMPSVIIQKPNNIALRYIMKKELLWAPCLDLVGHRLPNCFVDRYSADSNRQIESVRRMTADLNPREGVLIYPEGTRSTPEKRMRAMARLREMDPGFAERVDGFKNVLPPRPGGPLALLEENPGLDVVFCSHVGFEQAATIKELVNGALIHRTIRVRFWRIPFSEIPKTSAARIDWLIEHWRQVDQWIEDQSTPTERA